MKMIY